MKYSYRECQICISIKEAKCLFLTTFKSRIIFEEATLTPVQMGDRAKYLKEGMEVNILFWNDQVLDIELPTSVILEITDTDPGVKGDTATGGTKPAIVETGAQVMVPLFISIGERIKVDTRDGSYLGRE